MKAIEFFDYGTPHNVCRCVDVPEPGPPAADEVLVSVQACSINPADLLIIEGRYPGPTELPARLGIEGVGNVDAVGDEVTGLAPGDRVMLLGRANWAEKVCVPTAQVIRIPSELNLLQAAMIKVNPPTALLMLRDFVALKAGDWIIQNAANSAVGQHVIRLAKTLGVRSINVVRRQDAVAPLQALGADLVLVDAEDLGMRVRAEVGDGNVALALDAVCGRACLRLADCLSDGATVVTYGFLSGEPNMITPHHAIVHGITLQGFWLVARLFQHPREEIEAVYREIAQFINNGVIAAPVEAVYDLESVETALAHAERDGRSGKILFQM